MDGREKLKSALKKGVDWTFLVLEAVSDGLEVMAALQGRYRWVAFHQGIGALRRIEWQRSRRVLRQRVSLLKKRKLILEKKVAGRLHLSLTERGKAAFLRKIIAHAPLRSDGKSVMVVFDVPERSRRERDRLRTFLKTSGLLRLQQSVWMTKKDISAPLGTWTRSADIARWVRIFHVEEV